ncbi:MAG: hypothetical protein JSU73_08015 [candidate division WOR-3 bacterium]|nr:MAG: hypothetical protein JSU73_08015 [candidate division WOR-3 bacterium]
MEGLLARLRDVAASSQKLQKRLTAYRELLDRPVDNAFARERELAAIGRMVEGFPDAEVKNELAAWLESESRSVAEHRDEFRFRFGTALNASLKQAGLDAHGQLPSLRVGLFTVRVDFDSGKATVFWGPEVEKLKTGLPLSPEGLSRALKAWTEDLKSKSIPPDKFRKMLVQAYQRVVVIKGLGAGARVPLTEVSAELVMMMQPASFRADPSKSRFVEYPRVRFSYDLYRLRSAATADRAVKLRLHVATFDATTRKTTAIWVPDNLEGEGTYYAYLSVGGEA